MSRFGKMVITTILVSVVTMGAGYWLSLNMAVDVLKKHFEVENNKTIELVTATISNVKCGDTFEDNKESDNDILCSENIDRILDGVFKQGINVKMHSMGGSTFSSRENASQMSTISESLLSLAKIDPVSIEKVIMYTDVNGVREANGKVTIYNEPIAIYASLEAIFTDLVELFIVLGIAMILTMSLFSLLFLKEERSSLE